VKEVFAKCALDMGGVDALVHIAGVHREAPPELITDEDWDFVLDVNLRGTFITNQEAFPYLRDQGDGRIVNFGSMAGQVPYVLAAHYSASKGAVLSWSRTVAQAWGRYGIKVNAVTPAIETPMSHEVLEREQSNPDAPPRKSFSSTAGRDMGDPDRDMAPVLVFLLTDGARHITAQIIAVDGGMTPVR
jgi:NAD(P)-dependent dehydrogenase (short-subunit alcohol dehydrogenase family)